MAHQPERAGGGSRRRTLGRVGSTLVSVLSVLALVAALSAGSAAATGAGASPASATASALLVPGPRSVTGGGSHFCALTSTGAALCWGFNGFGELGDGTYTDRLVPTPVHGLSAGVTDISAGGQTTCVVVSGGARCWGTNGDGAVGDGTRTNRSTPTAVSGLSSGVKLVSVGYVHTCALTTAGGVECWGENVHGELGDGTATNRLTPVNVTGLSSGVVAIATGLDHSHRDHTCALTTAGGVECWGDNTYGELGDGTNTDRHVPTTVSGLASGVAAIFAGGTASCAVLTTGAARCWGNNDGGQLGDGTTTARNVPTAVSGLPSGVATIALSQSSAGEGGGSSHTCAVTTAGAVSCWGNNANGQLGDGSAGANQLVPTAVVGLSSSYVAVGVSFWGGCALSSTGAK